HRPAVAEGQSRPSAAMASRRGPIYRAPGAGWGGKLANGCGSHHCRLIAPPGRAGVAMRHKSIERDPNMWVAARATSRASNKHQPKPGSEAGGWVVRRGEREREEWEGLYGRPWWGSSME